RGEQAAAVRARCETRARRPDFPSAHQGDETRPGAGVDEDAGASADREADVSGILEKSEQEQKVARHSNVEIRGTVAIPKISTLECRATKIRRLLALMSPQ